jgi:3-phosphoshikimate 1-carboxyvinyltransferase
MTDPGPQRAAAPDFLELGPVERVDGDVALPGSKSISNRTLLLAALAAGPTRVRGLLDADDVDRMLEALATLGILVERGERRSDVLVHGAAGTIPVKAAKLFLGNAGTALRPLTAVLALAGGHYELGGVPRMHERPIGDLVDALRVLGADIRYLGRAGFPPLAIGPAAGTTGADGDRVAIRGDVSSQFLSALLMALPLATARTGRAVRVEVVGELISRPYVAITTNLMRRFGVVVAEEGAQRFRIGGSAAYASPGSIDVEGDASAASYFLAAGALRGRVRVTGVGRHSIQGDVAFADVLARMGARVAFGDDWIEARPGEALRGIDVDCTAIPDAAMTLAVVALFARGATTLTGIASWRVKETDRIAAMAAELAKLGAAVETGPDRLRIVPPSALVPATINTYDDHRIAMCFSLAALGGIAVRINDPGCVRKTFPGYFVEFARIARSAGAGTPADDPGRVPVIAVDGPAASGKGTVAAGVARALGFHLLDSGALYRLVALKALRAGIPLDAEAPLAAAAAALDVTIAPDGIRLDGTDVSDALRTEAVSAAASRVAAWPAVRGALLGRQRGFRQPPGRVADGRDMGTVVFPDALVKVFVTASVEERAARRHKQLIEKGNSVSIDSLLRDLRERDARDAGRTAAPLVAAADAVILDTTQLTVDAAVDFVLDRYRAAVAAGAGRHGDDRQDGRGAGKPAARP